jgi:hypothetical protein
MVAHWVVWDESRQRQLGEQRQISTLGKWFPDFAIEKFEGSGHHPMAEEPIRFATVAERFILSPGSN